MFAENLYHQQMPVFIALNLYKQADSEAKVLYFTCLGLRLMCMDGELEILTAHTLVFSSACKL